MFKSNIQRGCPGVDTCREVLICRTRKLKYVIQNKNDDHKNPNYSHNYHDEIELYQELVKWTHNDNQHQNNAHRKTSPIECDGV